MKTYIKKGKNYKVWYWIQKQNFHQHKRSISIKKDTNKIVISYKVSYGEKDFNYFIGSKDAKIRTYLSDLYLL